MLFADKQIDLNNVDLKKLKVRDLKKILNDWDENCDGCIEKGDYIKRIEDLKPKYVRDELWRDLKESCICDQNMFNVILQIVLRNAAKMVEKVIIIKDIYTNSVLTDLLRASASFSSEFTIVKLFYEFVDVIGNGIIKVISFKPRLSLSLP